MPIPRLETERLILRGFSGADQAPFAALNADPEVMRFMSRSLDRAASFAFLDRIRQQWATDGFGIWAVERRDDGAFLGFAGLSEPAITAPFTPAVEVGWRLARVTWGHGYATEVERRHSGSVSRCSAVTRSSRSPLSATSGPGASWSASG